MERIVEPEIMTGAQQARSYHQNDRNQIKHLFKISYQTAKKTAPATLVDLGCGPGDLTYEIAEFHPNTKVTGIDNSSEMLSFAKTRDNLEFKQMPITEVTENYARVISSLTLHHFHNPLDFWNSIKRIAPRDVFILDFLRPESEEQLQETIAYREYLDEDFKKDFENSLRACFTVDEIRQQLAECNLDLTIVEVDQYHLKAGLVVIAGMVCK